MPSAHKRAHTYEPPETEEDNPYEAFLQGVAPLKRPDRDAVPAPKPERPFSLPEPKNLETTHLQRIQPPEDSSITGNSVLSHRHPSLPERVWRRFKRRVVPEASCDLHGLTVAEAALVCEAFVIRAHDHDLRHVRIITGRGGDEARLKKSLAIWLPQWPMVLAWHTAKREAGGLGAVEVLLKANTSDDAEL